MTFCHADFSPFSIFSSLSFYPERNRESFENPVRRKCEKVPEKVDICFEYQAGKFDQYLDKDQNIEVTYGHEKE